MQTKPNTERIIFRGVSRSQSMSVAVALGLDANAPDAGSPIRRLTRALEAMVGTLGATAPMKAGKARVLMARKGDTFPVRAARRDLYAEVVEVGKSGDWSTVQLTRAEVSARPDSESVRARVRVTVCPVGQAAWAVTDYPDASGWGVGLGRS